MRVPRPLPNELAAHPFRVDDGLVRGLTRRRMRHSALVAPFWGIRTPADAATLRHLVESYRVRMPPDTFFSHATAAQLLGIPLPTDLASTLPLHVSTTTELRGPTGAGAVGHHLHIDPRDITVLDRVRATSPERTVFDLAARLSDEALLAAIDNILWHRRPSTTRVTPESLRDTFARFRGRRGRRRILELMPLGTDRSDSAPESAFRLRFLRAGFPAATPNLKVYDTHGQFVAMPDLQFPRFRMAFDYEGDHHRTDREQWRKDLRRVPRLQDAGWHHTRISGDDLADPSELLLRTRLLLLERGWRP